MFRRTKADYSYELIERLRDLIEAVGGKKGWTSPALREVSATLEKVAEVADDLQRKYGRRAMSPELRDLVYGRVGSGGLMQSAGINWREVLADVTPRGNVSLWITSKGDYYYPEDARNNVVAGLKGTLADLKDISKILQPPSPVVTGGGEISVERHLGISAREFQKIERAVFKASRVVQSAITEVRAAKVRTIEY